MTEALAAKEQRPMRPALATAAFFALLPALAAGGAIGLPALVAIAAIAAFQPVNLMQAVENKPFSLGLLALFLLWVVVSSLWSAWDGQTYLKVPMTVGFGLLFAASAAAPGIARLSVAGAIAALFVLVGLLIVEALAGSPLNRAAAPNETDYHVIQSPARGAVVMLALLWPAAAGLAAMRDGWRGWAIAAVIVGAGFVSLQFGQTSNALGFGLGAIFFCAALVAPRLAVLIPALGLAFWTLIAPFATLLIFAGRDLPEGLPHSWLVRVGIWQNTSERIVAQPWFGHGLDAGRAVSEMTTYDGEPMSVIPVHPHSAALQIWYDTGAVGAVLAATLIALLGIAASRAYAANRLAAAAAAAVFAMFGAMANIGWSPAQEWWLATMLLAGALVAAVGAVTSARA